MTAPLDLAALCARALDPACTIGVSAVRRERCTGLWALHPERPDPHLIDHGGEEWTALPEPNACHLVWLDEGSACVRDHTDTPVLTLRPHDAWWADAPSQWRISPVTPDSTTTWIHVRFHLGTTHSAAFGCGSVQRAPGLGPLLHLLLAEVRRFRSHRSEAIRSLLRLLTIEAKRASDNEQASERTLSPEAMYHMEQSVITEPGRTFTSADFADHFGYNRAYFAKLVHATYRAPFRSWLLRQRMRVAADLLTRTREPIAAIATQMGYLEATHFARRFKQVYGVTPRAYRVRPTGTHLV
ncbi:MAG: helix-turn-helix transcriptional regulator [Planctomycetota bacterium]|jgi:AraC-like DNA-binding protein|nr:helix-turn-helix transcriptional regulator [Planctomycetota bacterium]